MDKYRRQSTQTDSGPRELIQLHESAIPSGKRTCKKSIISFKLQHILFREKHRGLEILMRSRTTCCCSFSWLASGRECMISKNVNAACNTAGNWIASSIDRKWTRFFLKLKNLGILFLGSVLWARAVKKGGARPPFCDQHVRLYRHRSLQVNTRLQHFPLPKFRDEVRSMIKQIYVLIFFKLGQTKR